MPLDSLIRIIRVADQPVFQMGGGIRTRKIYTFSIGEHGPFTETFEGNEQHPDAIIRRLNEQAAQLRAVGAVPPAGSEA
jgi:hypothetical protein